MLLECLWCWRANPGLPELKICALPSTLQAPFGFRVRDWMSPRPSLQPCATDKYAHYQGAHGVFHGVIAEDRILLWPTYRRKKAWYPRMPNFNIPFVPFCVLATLHVISLYGRSPRQAVSGKSSRTHEQTNYVLLLQPLRWWPDICKPLKRNASVRTSPLCWEQIFSPFSAKATVGQQLDKEEGRERQRPSHWVCTISFS